MQRAQLGPPMVHMAKFDQNRLKDLGARRVDDTQTDTQTDRQTDKQTQAIIRAILRIGPKEYNKRERKRAHGAEEGNVESLVHGLVHGELLDLGAQQKQSCLQMVYRGCWRGLAFWVWAPQEQGSLSHHTASLLLIFPIHIPHYLVYLGGHSSIG